MPAVGPDDVRELNEFLDRQNIEGGAHRGYIRIFQNGEVVLRIEPFRRPMKWKDYEHEPPGE